MTTLASLFVPSPAIDLSAGKPCHFDLGFSRFQNRANLSTTSLLQTQRVPSRNFSPVSLSSTRSAPATRSNENRSPRRTVPRNVSQDHDVDVVPPQSIAELPAHGMDNLYHNERSPEECHASEPLFTREATGPNLAISTHLGAEDVVRQALTELRGQVRQSDAKPQHKSSAMVDQLISARPQGVGHHVSTHMEEVPSQSLSTEPLIDYGLKTCNTAGAGQDPIEEWTDRRMRLIGSASTDSLTSYHHHRPSTGSSRMIQTMKTASFSNASASLLQRSTRFGRSNGTKTHSSSAFPRPSGESERPPTASTLDEASMRRAFNRSQILQEIVTSEEGYLTDIRALLQLYETLFISTTTMSLRMKASVLRNVTDLLHLHEELIKDLQRVTLVSASKRWGESKAKRKLGRENLAWRSLRVVNSPRSERRHWRSRSSNETGELQPFRFCLHTAEPEEVDDIARTFKAFMPRFLVYEEYCAKYEIIIQELHRSMPRWAAFEIGIEALAKSVVALEVKSLDKRKALTIRDLLVKPIQRICKYPLLFSELLQNTPVIDGPSAHGTVDNVLMQFRDLVADVNFATDNPAARRQIQRRWLLLERLIFNDQVLKIGDFRMLGNIDLCGVLHVAYQTKIRIDGCYALCMLCGPYLVLALPAGASLKFMVVACVHLSDLKVDSACDGRGRHTPLKDQVAKLTSTFNRFAMPLCSVYVEGLFRS